MRLELGRCRVGSREGRPLAGLSILIITLMLCLFFPFLTLSHRACLLQAIPTLVVRWSCLGYRGEWFFSLDVAEWGATRFSVVPPCFHPLLGWVLARKRRVSAVGMGGILLLRSVLGWELEKSPCFPAWPGCWRRVCVDLTDD